MERKWKNPDKLGEFVNQILVVYKNSMYLVSESDSINT